MLPEDKKIMISVSTLDAVLNKLGEMPAKDVIDLINTIRLEAVPQLKPKDGV